MRFAWAVFLLVSFLGCHTTEDRFIPLNPGSREKLPLSYQIGDTLIFYERYMGAEDTLLYTVKDRINYARSHTPIETKLTEYYEQERVRIIDQYGRILSFTVGVNVINSRSFVGYEEFTIDEDSYACGLLFMEPGPDTVRYQMSDFQNKGAWMEYSTFSGLINLTSSDSTYILKRIQ